MGEKMDMKKFVEKSVLNWTVDKHQAYMLVGDEFVKVPNRFFTARNDGDGSTPTPFESVASGYTVIQNHDGFGCLSSLVDHGELVVDSALELSGGRTIAISTRLPEHVEIAGQDVATHLIFGTNHARGGSAVIFSHHRQLSCANELAALKIAKQHKYTIPHRRNAFIKLEDARKGLQMSFKHTEDMKEFGEKLATMKVDKSYYHRFLMSLTELHKHDPGTAAYRKAQGQCHIIHGIIRDSDYMNDYRFTRWGLYQGVTDYESNIRKTKGDANNRFMRLAKGGAELTNRAYDLLTV